MALEGRTRALGQDDPATLRSMSKLTSTYNNQGRLAEAVGLGSRALEGQKRVLGRDHSDTLWTRDMLIEVYERGGWWVAATDLRNGVY